MSTKNPKNRPTAFDILKKFNDIYSNEWHNSNYRNPTEIAKSSDIGPVTANNPRAIYKSRLLSDMIRSAMSLRSSKIQDQSINGK